MVNKNELLKAALTKYKQGKALDQFHWKQHNRLLRNVRLINKTLSYRAKPFSTDSIPAGLISKIFTRRADLRQTIDENFKNADALVKDAFSECLC